MKRLIKWNFLFGALACIVLPVTSEDTEDSNMIHPCGSQPTEDCVREYFKNNGEGTVVTTPNENPTYDINLPIYMPKCNLTAVTLKIYPKNLNGEIIKFGFDKLKGNLVYSVRFSRLNCLAPETIFAVSRWGKEPRTFLENVNATYPTDTILTAIIPVDKKYGINNRSLKDAIVTASFQNNDAILAIGPNFSKSEDPDISESYACLIANPFLMIQEIFRTKAAFYFLIYLQSRISDYGIAPNIQTPVNTDVYQSIIDNDNTEQSIFRPCDQSTNKKRCVLDYFAEHGTGTVLYQPKPEPVLRPTLFTAISWLNATAVPDNGKLGGLNGDIEDFYINQKTQNLVMAVRFQGISLYSPSLTIGIYKMGKQPKYFTDYNKDVYPVDLTCTINIKNGLTAEAVKNLVAAPYFWDTNISYEFGPVIAESTDPDMVAVLKGARLDPVTSAQEIFVTEAISMFKCYLQNQISDFGVPC